MMNCGQDIKHPLGAGSESYTLWLMQYFQVDSVENVRWGHAVNTIEKLKACVSWSKMDQNDEASHKEKQVHMIEIDLRTDSRSKPQCSGDKYNSNSQVRMEEKHRVILSHDETESGEDFEEWLNCFLKVLNEANPSIKLGLKLDFKTRPSVLGALACILKHRAVLEELEVPIWLNADVISGFGCDTLASFDENDEHSHNIESFIEHGYVHWLKESHNTRLGGPMGLVLSIGFRTKNTFPNKTIRLCKQSMETSESVNTFPSEEKSSCHAIAEAPYSSTLMHELIESAILQISIFRKNENLGDKNFLHSFSHITIPLRTAFVPASTEAIIDAIVKTRPLWSSWCTLSITLWCNQGDAWNQSELLCAIQRFKAFGVEVFMDL